MAFKFVNNSSLFNYFQHALYALYWSGKSDSYDKSRHYKRNNKIYKNMQNILLLCYVGKMTWNFSCKLKVFVRMRHISCRVQNSFHLTSCSNPFRNANIPYVFVCLPWEWRRYIARTISIYDKKQSNLYPGEDVALEFFWFCFIWIAFEKYKKNLGLLCK